MRDIYLLIIVLLVALFLGYIVIVLVVGGTWVEWLGVSLLTTVATVTQPEER